MAQHLAKPVVSRGLALFAAALGLIAAIAAMALPTTEHVPEIAAVLAVGSLAMLAGHAWGLLIVAIADVALIGKLWPMLIYPPDAATAVLIAAAVGLVGALPGLVLLGRTLPGTVDVLIGRRDPRYRRAVVAGTGLLACAWLVLPIF